MLPYKRYRSTAQRSIEEAKTARYKNSATGFDCVFLSVFQCEQQSPTPLVDKTSNARQVQNHKRSPQLKKQSVTADRCLELAVDYLSPNDRVAGYTNPLQFEGLGPCADC